MTGAPFKIQNQVNSNKEPKSEYLKILIMALPIIVAGYIAVTELPKTHEQTADDFNLLTCKTLLKMSDDQLLTVGGYHDVIQKQINEKRCLERK